LKLKVVIQPNSKNNAVVGFQAEALKIKIKSPPVDGEANKTLIKFLSEELRIPQKNIHLLHGKTGKNKLIEIDTDLSEKEIISLLMKK
jgi:uncharacterized protein (TIGR00251 family)